MKCANHPDRAALGYCSRCGKALCNECLVRLSTGNFCDTCANPGMGAARQRRPMPWWLIVVGAAVLLFLARLLVH